MPGTYDLGTAHGRIQIEVVGIENLFARIADESLNVLEGFQIMAEGLPTCGELIYRCLNKPWEKQNWELLFAGWRVTRRKLRKARAELEDMKHARWARKLNTRKEFRAQ